MSDIAIRVQNLSKLYRISAAQYRHDTLRDQLMDGLKSIFKRRSQSNNGSDTFWALKDISFEVKKGELIGILGRNGAGKSTLLKILSRITEPTTGRVEINGRVGSLLEVGTGFDRELTGRENIYLSGAILGMKKAEISRKFDEIIAFAEVEKFIDTPVKRYSSGMYVRLAFAVAAHLEPEILLVDEVLAVGDASFQKKCLGRMDQVSKGGRTVFFVSHNMAMIENLCQKAIQLRQGCVAEIGPTRHVIDSYLKEISGLSSSPLAKRRDRSGAGEIIVARIEFLDSNSNHCAYPISGQQLLVRLHYQSNSSKNFKNCRISISLHKEEHVYFLMSTELVDNSQLDLQGIGYIDFILPELPLSGGEYYLNTFIESNKVIQDWVINASTLSVVDGDFYGTGRNYPPGWQGKCVLVKYGWRLGNAAFV